MAAMETRLRAVALVVTLLALVGCSNDGGAGEGRAGDPGTKAESQVSLTPITEVPTPDKDQPPTTYDEAVDHLDGAPVQSLDSFQSPSGNLHCRFVQADPDGVSCEVLEGRVAPADGDSCPAAVGVDTVGRIELVGDTVRALCNTDTLVDPSNEVLPYGNAVKVGRIACVIEEIGVTCLAADTRQGFFLARGTYRLFR